MPSGDAKETSRTRGNERNDVFILDIEAGPGWHEELGQGEGEQGHAHCQIEEGEQGGPEKGALLDMLQVAAPGQFPVCWALIWGC